MAALAELSTVRLIVLAKRGDSAAWDVLFRRYGHRVRTYAVNRCNGDWNQADDIASEAWIKALTRIKTWKPRGRDDDDFVRWLFGMVRGSLGEARGAAWKESPAEFSYGSLLDAQWFEMTGQDDYEADDFDDAVNKEVMIERLRGEIARLSRTCRRVVRMRLDGAPTEEITKETGLSAKQIGDAWRRSQTQLRRKLLGRIDVAALSDTERAELLALAEELPDISREVAVLRLNGMEAPEIESRTGMTRSQVHNAWRHAEDLLRKLQDDPALARRPKSGRLAQWQRETDRLRAAVPLLSPALQDIATMRLNGMSHPEIARALHRPVGSIGSAWRSALDTFTRAGLIRAA